MIAIAPGVKIPSEITSGGPSIEWHSKALIRGVESLTPEMKASWIWWRMEPPAQRQLDLVDILEEDSSDLGWHSVDETKRLLDTMSAGHREKVMEEAEKTKQTGAPGAAGLYKRTREGVVRAEVRFDGIAGCLRTPGGGSSRQTVLVIEDGRIRSRLLSAREAARLMGLPDSYRLPERYNDAYHLAGDGVAVPVVEALRRGVFERVLGFDLGPKGHCARA
jgi:DNA (cytosine-5)-methyltransferase 1